MQARADSFSFFLGSALALLATLAPSLADQARFVDLEVQIHARRVAVGEALRVVAHSPLPLTALEGRLLGRDFAMVRARADPAGETWSGWAAITLSDEPGSTILELEGTSAEGGIARASYALRIEPTRFEEQHLKVASKYVDPPKAVQERIARERALLAEVYARRTPLLVPGPFVRPAKGEQTSPFGARRMFNGKPRSSHNGLDFAANTGDAIVSAARGQVALAQDLYFSGQCVIVDHGGGLFSIYAHLSQIAVQEGDLVEAGQLLGLAGATGRATGPHLHWGVKVGAEPVAPDAFFDERLFPMLAPDLAKVPPAAAE